MMTNDTVQTVSSSVDPSSVQSLWERATAKLQEKDKAFLIFNSSVNLKDLISRVEVEKEKYKSNRLVVKRGANREPVVLHEVFSKIVGWIEKFVAVGDTAMQYDTGHAALPWAAIRLISIQDARSYAAVVEGIENVTRIITYYKIMESIYFRKGLKTTEEAKNALVDLYASILMFLAKTRRYLAKNSLNRICGSMIDFENKIQSILRDVGEKDARFQRYAVLMDAECQENAQLDLEAMGLERKQEDKRLRALFSDMQRPIDRIEKRFQDYQDGLQAETRLQILSWLSPIPYMQHHIQVNSDVMPGTGQWLLYDARLLDWQSSRSSSVLWLHGIPGSGKSKLVSILIKRLLDRIDGDNGSHPAFFYCTRNPAERERATTETILRSLVRQLSCPRPGRCIEAAVRDLYNTRIEDGLAAGPLSLKESISMLIQLSAKRRFCYIIIDALDECYRQEREFLLDALSQLVKESTGIVKIFISSRDDMDIVRSLAGGPNVQISAESNQSDIATFVHVEVDKQIQKKRLLSGHVSETLRHKIKQVLCDQAQGMFRWVTLQLNYLCRIKVANLVERRLGKLPQDLWKIYHETYTERFEEYQREEVAITQNALRWLICSQVPLSSETLLALASSSADQRPNVSISRDDLLDLCFNFVVHDTGLNVFRFSHLSVREYLESIEQYQLASCHAFAAESCLRFFTSSFNINQIHLQGHEDCVKDSLADPSGVEKYMCTYWPHHLKQSGMHRHLEPLKTLFCAFTMVQQSPSSPFSLWNRKISLLQDDVHDSGKYSRRRLVIGFPADPLFVACVWDFEELLHWRVNTDTRSLDVQNVSGMTALHITCRLGNVKAARILIENGISHQAMVNGQTALKLATLHRHANVVRLLMHKGICSDTDVAYNLYQSVRERDTIMAHTLVELEADLHTTGSGNLCCAFHQAVENGQALIVDKMLEKMGVTEAQKNEWLARTRLMSAVASEADLRALFHQDGFGILLDQETLQAGLWKSCSQGNFQAAKTLIEAGADVNLGNIEDRWWIGKHNGSTATGHGFGKQLLGLNTGLSSIMIDLILDSGALVDPPAFQGQLSPLESAILAGRENVVNMLIERGARIDRRDYILATGPMDLFLGSLLDLAESRGYVAIAGLLSRRGASSAVRRLTYRQFEELKQENIYELEG